MGDKRRFFNPAQPQTLQIAVILMYFRGGYLLLLMVIYFTLPLLIAAQVLAYAAAGYGIANEKRWGYALGIVMSFLPFFFSFLNTGNPVGGFDPLNLIFAVALVALLLHTQSREYQRIWFK